MRASNLYERILPISSPIEIYKFHHHINRGQGPPELTEVLYQQAHPAPVVREAVENRSGLCRNAIELFVSIYGAKAGKPFLVSDGSRRSISRSRYSSQNHSKTSGADSHVRFFGKGKNETLVGGHAGTGYFKRQNGFIMRSQVPGYPGILKLNYLPDNYYLF